MHHGAIPHRLSLLFADENDDTQREAIVKAVEAPGTNCRSTFSYRN